MNSNISNYNPNVAVVLTDAQRRILWVNSYFYEMTGYMLGEVLGQKPSILQGKNTQPDVVCKMRKNFEAENPKSLKVEIINYRKNGEEYPCRVVIHPIFNIGKKLTNFLAFEVDATLINDDSHIPMMQVDNSNYKYSSSPLTNRQELELFSNLLTLVEKDKLYLNPNLKMSELAKSLGTNTRYLSQVVNHQTGENLAKFINRYRVEETKLKMMNRDYNYLTTFAIANMSGFNTKSTFYKSFKEIEGMTPLEYAKRIKDKVHL